MVDRSGRRNTRQRQVVLDELRKLHSHPTASELYEIARRRLPKISLGTVYRNLELLAGDGTIRKLDVPGAEARFDGDLSEHYHVRCVHCGRVGDVHETPVRPAGSPPREVGGFQIIGYRLEFLGVCPECGGSTESEAGGPPNGQK